MPTVSAPPPPDDEGQAPLGTFAIVAVFGGLVVVGWLALYLGVFLPRNTP